MNYPLHGNPQGEPVIIQVTGKPIGKGRARLTTVHGQARAFTPAKTRSWENDCRQLARIEMRGTKPLEGPLVCIITAAFVPPASWPKWKREAALQGRIGHTGKPDADNVAKAAKDALNGVVWGDDAQVVNLSVAKLYAEQAAVTVQVWRIGMAPAQITRKGELAA